MLAVVALGLAGFSGGSASAVTPPGIQTKVTGLGTASTKTAPHANPAPRTKAAWQADMAHVRQPGHGCYNATYPALTWHAVKCVAASRWQMAPRLEPSSVGHGEAAPTRVGGGGNDYVATAPGSGLIERVTGTFTDVSPGITETGQVNGQGPQVANAFSLQMNTQFFSGPSLCSGSSDPSHCQGWEQFLYAYDDSQTSSIWMSYWLIGYNATCPTGWATSVNASGNSCFMNTTGTPVPTLTAKQLGSVVFMASATSSGDDLLFSFGSGIIYSRPADDLLELSSHWNTTQWGVYGDAGGAEAYFGANTTLEPQTAMVDTQGSAPPICDMNDFTGESNNLGLSVTPELGGEPDPTMASLETSGGSGTPSCATTGGTTVRGAWVCDIYASDETPCAAAYSMDRALYSGYNGPLYQVKRASDGATANIGLSAAGGDVNASEQDSFCASTSCTITEIYDQSPKGNNLTIEGAGENGAADSGAVANALPITIGGHEAYGLDITPGTGYRDDNTSGIAAQGGPESMYMVASGTNVNSGCCFDFGNAETNNYDNGDGHMDAVNLTTFCGSYEAPCTGHGPWVEADMENGQYLGGNGSNPADTPSSSDFVTAMLANNGQTVFRLEGGNAQSGYLTKYWDNQLPKSSYMPMHQEGAIVLGTGGDNSNYAVGSFFEGVMTEGVPDQEAEDAVQASIVNAGYAGNSAPSSTNVASAAGQAVVHRAGATGAAASGYSSVYTVDSANGDLQESYLPYMGASWATQDLSAKYGTPAVMPGTKPVSIVHCGYTSVYTVDASSGDLQETYLPAIGDSWLTQDLSAKYGTPPTTVTPTAVVHNAGAVGASPGCEYTSVYTRDRNGDLQETYLPVVGFPGDPWTTQDLSVKYGTPGVLSGTSPVAVVHCGYTSVYTVDANHQLQETYLAAISDSWLTQSLSAKYGTPDTITTPTAVVHTAGVAGASPGCGFTSVYTVDQGNDNLQETWLPIAGFPGDPWNTQNLSVKYGTPPVAPGTEPEALVHMDYTSLYTVDQGTDDLQETYLAANGDPWGTQNLSVKYGTPTTDQSPIVLVHPDQTGHLDWTSVFTIDEFSHDLQETYLNNVGFPGDSWATQNLSAKYGTPEVTVPESPTAGASVDHEGYTSVYTVDKSNGHLQETYLSAMGKPWGTQDLSALYGTPQVLTGTTPVAVTHDGFTSVFTIDTNGDLQETYLSNVGFPGDAWLTQDLSVKYGTPESSDVAPTAVFHDGYTSVYTIDTNGDLQETYLPGAGFPGDPWVTQNLSVKYGTPAASTGTSPIAVVHDGFTSVYTVDASSNDLQETYLPYMGAAWTTQDLSLNYGAPAVNPDVSPNVIVHDGYTSIYTVDASSGDLQETFLAAIGDPWVTQDLTAKYGVPTVTDGTEPVALYHDGYTSIYTDDVSTGDVQETYLPAIGDAWTTQDLSTRYGVPKAFGIAAALVHYDTSGGLTWTSVFTIDENGDLQESYLSATGFPGDAWGTQDLSANYGTPPA